MFANGEQVITGFQVHLQDWAGAGVGLHRMELLSNGGDAQGAQGQNYPVCTPGSSSSSDQTVSNVEQTGQWTSSTVSTSIPGTVQVVSVASVLNGASERPSVTWYPYITSSGNYSVYLNIPGCQHMGDCGSRADVDLGVSPFAGSLRWTDTFSQAVDEDERRLIYSGWMEASTPGAFQSTISLKLTDNPPSTSSGTWDVVAGSVTLQYEAAVTKDGQQVPLVTGANETSSASNATTVPSRGTNTTRRAFGVFEWTISGDSQKVDATSNLSNQTATDITTLGFALNDALGTSTAGTNGVKTFTMADDTIYVGGNFTSSDTTKVSNHVVGLNSKTRSVMTLPDGGLDGPVTSSIHVNGKVYFGGSFKTTSSGENKPNMNGLACYDPSDKSWAGLGQGVAGGSVTDLVLAQNGQDIIVLGDFTEVANEQGDMLRTGGFAKWNTRDEKWSNDTGLVLGNVADGLVVESDENSDQGFVYLAGRIRGISSNLANGMVYLSGSGDQVKLEPARVDLALASNRNASSINKRSGHVSAHAHSAIHLNLGWLSKRVSEVLTKRQAAEDLATLPNAQSPSPLILSVVYWKNETADNSPTVTCIGGNFTLDESQGSTVAFYDASSSTTTALQGEQPSGVVRSLEVVDDNLVMVGNFTLGDQSSIVSYNLKDNKWNAPIAGATANGGPGDIFVVKKQPNANNLIVAGNFDNVGSLPCVGVCSWDLSASRWSTLGSGLGRGQVRTIAFVEVSGHVERDRNHHPTDKLLLLFRTDS